MSQGYRAHSFVVLEIYLTKKSLKWKKKCKSLKNRHDLICSSEMNGRNMGQQETAFNNTKTFL